MKRLKCREQVERRLLAGDPVRQVAAWIQGVQGESLDVAQASLAMILWRFLRDVRADIEQGPSLTSKRVDELNELGRTYVEQRARLTAALEEDQRNEQYTASLTADVEQLLRTLARRHAVKMDLGIPRMSCEGRSGDGATTQARRADGSQQESPQEVLDSKMRSRIVAMIEMARERARGRAEASTRSAPVRATDCTAVVRSQ